MNWKEVKTLELLALKCLLKLFNNLDKVEDEEITYLEDFRHYLRVTNRQKFVRNRKIGRKLTKYQWWLLTENEDSTSLEFGDFSPEDLSKVSKSEKNFKFAESLTFNATDSNSESVQNVLKKASFIKKLQIEGKIEDELLGETIALNCPNLKKLKLNKFEDLTDDGLIDFIEDSKSKIEELDIAYYSDNAQGISFKSICKLDKMKSLRKFCVSVKQLKYFSLVPENYTNENITFLKLKFDYLKPDCLENLTFIEKIFPRVKKLHVTQIVFGLRSMSHFQSKIWKHSVTEFKSDEMNFNLIHKLTQDSFPNIKVLKFDWDRDIYLWDPPEIWQNNIEYLIISNQYENQMNDNLIRQIIHKFSNLKKCKIRLEKRWTSEHDDGKKAVKNFKIPVILQYCRRLYEEDSISSSSDEE